MHTRQLPEHWCTRSSPRALTRALYRIWRTYRKANGVRAGVVAAGLAALGPQAVAQTFPPIIDLETLFPDAGGDGSVGVVFPGIAAGDHCGRSVSAAGDVNGDGVDDLIIGADRAGPSGNRVAGESYVVFGRTGGFPAVFDLAKLYPANGGDGSEGFVLEGIAQLDHAGYAVGAAGDVNGDGIDDLIIGARYANLLAGQSYVVFGRADGFPPVFELASLLPAGGGDGSRGFVLEGIKANDGSGRAVSAAGDVNADGIDDVILGATGASPDGVTLAGESYVVFGRSDGFPAVFELRSLLPEVGGDGSAGVVLQGVDPNDRSGTSLSGARDVNADSIGDLVIGARFAEPAGKSSAGEAYVVFGRPDPFPAVFELGSLSLRNGGDGSSGFVLPGVDALDRAGRSVSLAGDINADGVHDLLIGAWGGDRVGARNAGEAYLVFGRSGGFPPEFELQSLLPTAGGDGSAGFVIRGVARDDHAGFPVSAAGDVNGDGVEDLLVGAFLADTYDGGNAGESYVVFGRTQGFPALVDLRLLFPSEGGDGSVGFVVQGVEAGDQSGFSVSAAGDVNGDGAGDLLIGARFADSEAGEDAGEAYLVFGRAPGAGRGRAAPGE